MIIRGKRRNWPGVLLSLALILTSIALPSKELGAWPVKSYRELRFDLVAEQNSGRSCGPASLKTLFQHFFGIKLRREKVLKTLLKKKKIDPKSAENVWKEEKLKVSLLDLKKTSIALGVTAKGYQLKPPSLRGVLEKIESPLLLHFQRPEEHFLLAVEAWRGKVLLADPSRGLRLSPQEEVNESWDGLVLAFSPGRKRTREAGRVAQGAIRSVKKRRETLLLATAGER